MARFMLRWIADGKPLKLECANLNDLFEQWNMLRCHRHYPTVFLGEMLIQFSPLYLYSPFLPSLYVAVMFNGIRPMASAVGTNRKQALMRLLLDEDVDRVLFSVERRLND